MKISWHYTKKSLGIYWWHFLHWFNSKILKTYPSNPKCARCRDCGRTVHDFRVDDELWDKVIGREGVWCWDCFCERAAQKGIYVCMPNVYELKIKEKPNKNIDPPKFDIVSEDLA